MEGNKKRRIRIVRKKNKKKKIINIITNLIRNIVFLVIVFILSYMSCGIYQEAKVRTVSLEETMIKKKNEYKKGNSEKDNKIVNKQTIIPVAQEYQGYKVECRLEIPKIGVETNVLSEYTEDGLDICVSKYYGPNPNEVGNYCVAGHNYNKENMFNHLIDLDLGDSIFLTDNENGKVEYSVYDIYKVKPYNTNSLSQETVGERELTLITCVNYSKNRLIVKAVEKGGQ